MKIRAVITGSTGMVGEGVLHECILHPDVEKILLINRRPCGIVHDKVEELIHDDFYNLSAIEGRLVNYNACYFCAGVSSLGMSEDAYYKISYTMTLHVAETLLRHNPGMIFCYVSGSGTDSTEKGKIMWARVKGKTENDLMKLPFKNTYMFRPGYMQPTKGLKNTLKFYKYIDWMYPLFRFMMPNQVSLLSELGLAMIHVSMNEYPKQILDVKDIVKLAGKK